MYITRKCSAGLKWTGLVEGRRFGRFILEIEPCFYQYKTACYKRIYAAKPSRKEEVFICEYFLSLRQPSSAVTVLTDVSDYYYCGPFVFQSNTTPPLCQPVKIFLTQRHLSPSSLHGAMLGSCLRTLGVKTLFESMQATPVNAVADVLRTGCCTPHAASCPS